MDESFEAPALVADNAVAETTEAPSAQETSAPVEAPEFFSENFDPATLDEHLQPAYKQMQGAFTKKTQELAEQRKEAESAVAFIQALQSDDQRAAALQQLAAEIGEDAVFEALGLDVAAEEPDLPEDPGERALAEIEALKAERAQAAAQAQDAERIASLDKFVTDQFADLGDVDQSEQDLIVAYALASLPPDENGMPPIKAAHEKLTAVWEAKQKKWLESKQAQSVSGAGQAGVEQFDIRNPEERIKRMAAIMDANAG